MLSAVYLSFLERSGGEARLFGGERTAVGDTRVVVGGEVNIIPDTAQHKSRLWV